MLNKVANKMSVQELCDFAVKAMVEQGCRSVGEVGCAYSDGHGNHCGIGHITNSKYHFDWEEEGVNVEMKYLPKPIKDNINIFDTLQSFHDSIRLVHRKQFMDSLNDCGIDTSGLHWQKWVDLGGI